MEVVVWPSPVTTTATVSAIKPISCLALGRNTHFLFYSLSPSFPGKITLNLRKSVIAAAKKKKKEDNHSHVAKPDEATGPFPEAVLLKEKKVQEDGRLLPEFADDEEQELFELLNLELESELNVDRMRHYEVVYLIHEDRAKEVGNVNTKVEDFIKEKKGRIWRFSDWGLRRLAYKIQKAKYAHYVLMNFELPANWINDFKTMLDKDERVIRHLVMKRDKAETEDCPPPSEFHTVYAGMDDEEDDDFDNEDEIDMDENGDENEEAVIYVDDYIEKDSEIAEGEKSSGVNGRGRRKLKHEKVGR